MPPPETSNKFDAPLVHKIFDFYKKIYLISFQISKRHRFGIYSKIENLCFEIMDSAVAACFETKNNKLPILNSARIKTEILKRFIRTAYELKIIENKNYLILESDLQEISKMVNGWIKYLR